MRQRDIRLVLAGLVRSPRRDRPATEYRLWLDELLATFGANAMGRWDHEPHGWDFEAWRARRANHEAVREHRSA